MAGFPTYLSQARRRQWLGIYAFRHPDLPELGPPTLGAMLGAACRLDLRKPRFRLIRIPRIICDFERARDDSRQYFSILWTIE